MFVSIDTTNTPLRNVKVISVATWITSNCKVSAISRNRFIAFNAETTESESNLLEQYPLRLIPRDIVDDIILRGF